MKWTKNQKLAIETEGSNIIISAGAGSGKTAVLTARVLRKLKEGVSIKNLLILTFTRNAAAEMKSRIRKKIASDPNLKSQLPLIESSYITTFDSYALSVVRKYHYLLNVSANVSIIDDNIINLEIDKIIDNIFNYYYQTKEKDFLEMVGDLCVKDDKIIKDAVLSLYYKLDLRLDKETYLKEYINDFYQKEHIESIIKDYHKFLESRIKEIKAIFYETLNACETDDYYERLEASVSPLFSNNNSYEKIKDKLSEIKLPPVPRGSSEEFKVLKKYLNDSIIKLKDELTYNNTHEIKEALLSTQGYVGVLIKILLTLDKELEKFKFTSDSYTYTDIAKLAIKIVEEYPEVKMELKNNFNEIMIDEYQDTSDIQERFVNLIADNNVYMVGDLKQSIYRFRNANPDIFKDKYNLYAKGEGGIKIDLQENFRSRKEVIEDINLVFDELMDESYGGVDYPLNGRMVFGNQSYENIKAEQNYHMDIYDYEDLIDLGYKSEEIEAFIIASDIKNKLKENFKVNKNGKLETAKYSDFTILLDRSKDFTVYKQIFEYLQIPLTVVRDEELTNENDILVIKNIMKFIIKIDRDEFDQEFKYLFTSIARSFLGDLTDQEIFDYFVNNDFYNSDIYKIAKKISKALNALSNREFLKLIIDQFNIPMQILTIGNVNEGLIRIEYLLNIADNLAELGYDVYSFTEYVEMVIEKDLKITYSVDNDTGDAVRIMTIHQSKGLESNICYYAGLFKGFNKGDLKNRFVYDEVLGIIVPYYKDGINETILKDLYKDKVLTEDISERIRLLYVAMTRTKEKEILLNTYKEVNKMKKHLNNFSEFINQLPFLDAKTVKINKDDVPITKDYQIVKASNFKEKIKLTHPLVVEEVNLESKKVMPARFSKDGINLISESEQRTIDFGNQLHYLLEIIDLQNPDLDSLDLKPDISQKIKSFLNSPLLENIKDANVLQEYQFTNNNRTGIIDLILEFDDKIILIDYKLKNLDDPAYIKQTLGYKEFLENKTKKQVFPYLYSLIDEEYILVGE